MRILIVSQYYWPEDFSAGVYVTEMAEGLKELGHEVEVLTGFPNFPEGRIFPGYTRQLGCVEVHNGVKVVRGWFYPSPRSSGNAQRGLSALSFSVSALLRSSATRRADIVLGLSPPPFMGLAGWRVARHWGVPYVLCVKDFFTEAILSAGLTQSGMLTGLLSRLEQFLYRHTDHLIVPTPAFREQMVYMGLPEASISVVPDWADGDVIRPSEKENEIREEWGIRNCFVLLYSGSMGHSSRLETVLQAASQLRDLKDVRFVLVGDGIKRPLLESMARELNLDNVQFHPLQSRERFPRVLSSSDVTLITLSPGGGKVSTQGKLYSLLAAGRAVLGVVPAENDACAILHEGRCGWCVEPDDPDGLARLVREQFSFPEAVAEKGRNSRTHFDSHFSKTICVEQIQRILLEQTRPSALALT